MTDFAHTIGFLVLGDCFVYDGCNDVFDEEPGCRIKPSVLIIGAGPVGLTAAAFLTHYGIPVRIIDKKLEAIYWVLACAGYHSVLRDDCHVPYVVKTCSLSLL